MKYVIPITIIFMVGCSSTPPTGRQPVVAADDPEYVVRERRPSSVPQWVDSFNAWKRQEEPKTGMLFFMGESGAVEDRISGQEVARLNARKQIADYIANLISGKIATSTSGTLFRNPNSPDDNGLRRAFEQDLAGKSMALLTGVKDWEDYFEKRDYSKSGGARTVYEVSVVVGISEKDMKEALLRTAKKAPEVVEDKEAKVKVENSLKDIDREFKQYSSAKGGN